MSQRSDGESSRPIPIPATRRLQSLRERALPLVTFAALVAGVAVLWQPTIAPSAIVAEAKPTRATVLTTIDGTVVELAVRDMQRVRRGDELVVLSALDPEALRAERAAIEADLLLMRERMSIDRARNLDALAQLSARLLEERVSLGIAQVNLSEAESTFAAVERLYERQLVPKIVDAGARTGTATELGYDAALSRRNALRGEVEGRRRTIAQLERDVATMSAGRASEAGSVDHAIETAIRAQQARIESLQGRTVLRAPIDGFVSVVSARVGERVPAGQALLVVSGARAEEITAWVRQPISVRPSPGDVVRVRRSGAGEPFAEATVTRVGTQLETISPTLVIPTENSPAVEVGLPFLISVPKQFELLPGERVEVAID